MDGSRLTFFTYFNPLSIKSYSLGVLYVNNTRDGASSACRAMGYKLLRYGQCVTFGKTHLVPFVMLDKIFVNSNVTTGEVVFEGEFAATGLTVTVGAVTCGLTLARRSFS
jgi:hypothetical protein